MKRSDFLGYAGVYTAIGFVICLAVYALTTLSLNGWLGINSPNLAALLAAGVLAVVLDAAILIGEKLKYDSAWNPGTKFLLGILTVLVTVLTFVAGSVAELLNSGWQADRFIALCLLEGLEAILAWKAFDLAWANSHRVSARLLQEFLDLGYTEACLRLVDGRLVIHIPDQEKFFFNKPFSPEAWREGSISSHGNAYFGRYSFNSLLGTQPDNYAALARELVKNWETRTPTQLRPVPDPQTS
jgi:hypothetical protein